LDSRAHCNLSVQITQQLLCPLRAPQFSESALFDLANPLARQVHFRANLRQRLWLAVTQPEPPLDNDSLFVVELSQKTLKLFLE
jgi:hypothetical protein